MLGSVQRTFYGPRPEPFISSHLIIKVGLISKLSDLFKLNSGEWLATNLRQLFVNLEAEKTNCSH